MEESRRAGSPAVYLKLAFGTTIHDTKAAADVRRHIVQWQLADVATDLQLAHRLADDQIDFAVGIDITRRRLESTDEEGPRLQRSRAVALEDPVGIPCGEEGRVYTAQIGDSLALAIRNPDG